MVGRGPFFSDKFAGESADGMATIWALDFLGLLLLLLPSISSRLVGSFREWGGSHVLLLFAAGLDLRSHLTRRRAHVFRVWIGMGGVVVYAPSSLVHHFRCARAAARIYHRLVVRFSA
ncbi:hypothetical protein IWZ03DRAFT_5379 [Phyllosticta citriasiana]|uniref:Uncharacterized protein n=1 Tax=Phyllosticta citriasiana TaxID=595635 RepID=A0ABR1KXY0_9PEZI